MILLKNDVSKFIDFGQPSKTAAVSKTDVYETYFHCSQKSLKHLIIGSETMYRIQRTKVFYGAFIL